MTDFECQELIIHPENPNEEISSTLSETLLTAVINNNEEQLNNVLPETTKTDFTSEHSYNGTKKILTLACVESKVSENIFQILFDYAMDHFSDLDFTEKKWYYWEPIHFAACHTNVDKLGTIVKRLKQINKLNILTIFSENALHVLLEYGRRVDSFNVQLSNGWESRICHVIAKEKFEVVQCAKLLIDAGIDVNHSNIWNETPIIIAIRYRLMGVIELLLRRSDIDLDTCKDSVTGKSARDILRQNEICLHLLTPSTVTVSPAKTLFTFLKNGNEEMFLRYNNENIRQYANEIDGDPQNKICRTMLQLCLIKGYIDYEKEIGIIHPPQETDILKTPMLKFFCQGGFGRSIEHLLNNGAEITKKVMGDQDVFQMAVKLNYYPFLAILLEHRTRQITQYHILEVLRNIKEASLKSQDYNVRHVLFLLISKLEMYYATTKQEALQAMEKELLACIRFLFVRISWIFRKCLNYFRSVVLALRLSGPPALPILGNVLTIKDSKALIDIGNNILKFNSPLCRTWMFFIPIILVFEPDHLKIILSNTKVSDKNFFYRIMHTFVGDGLITSTGDKWKKNRKLIQPCFQINLLENYVEDFVKVSEEVLNGLSGQGYVQITKVINTCVINILHRTVLGVNLQKEDETPFRRGELLILKRVLKPWLLLESVFKLSEMSKSESTQSTALHCYVKKILDDRLSQRKEKNIKNTCILDRLIDLSETSDFTEEDILNETVTFMLAGQDSVGAAVAFCLYQLAKHQDIQEKVYKEITEIIYGDHLKAVEVRQLSQMNYLEQCIKETMRLIPSIPLIARVLSADVTLGNYTLPTGTNIFISPFATHRLPHIFPDPLKFDPDRFSPENAKKIHPYGFLPFSIGPRNCIGYKFAYLEMKTIIASLVKNFHLALKPGHEDISLAYRVTLRAKGGIWLNIQPRNRTYAD